MKSQYYLGKCDGYGNGRKSCKAYFTWKLTDDGRFSMSGEIWNSMQTDIIQGGQCCDTILKYFPSDQKAKRMVEIWKRWHLNDMQAGCQHQRADHWEDRRINPKDLPHSYANRDEQGILAIWIYPIDVEHPYRDAHKNGLLTKPCPICGYKYGSAWLKEEIPAEIIEEIKSW